MKDLVDSRTDTTILTLAEDDVLSRLEDLIGNPDTPDREEHFKKTLADLREYMSVLGAVMCEVLIGSKPDDDTDGNYAPDEAYAKHAGAIMLAKLMLEGYFPGVFLGHDGEH